MLYRLHAQAHITLRKLRWMDMRTTHHLYVHSVGVRREQHPITFIFDNLKRPTFAVTSVRTKFVASVSRDLQCSSGNQPCWRGNKNSAMTYHILSACEGQWRKPLLDVYCARSTVLLKRAVHFTDSDINYYQIKVGCLPHVIPRVQYFLPQRRETLLGQEICTRE